MRNGIRVMTLTMLSAMLVALTAAQEEYTLKLQVKEGDVFKYRFTMEITFGDQSAVFTMNLTNKVIKVESNGDIVFEGSSSDGMVKFGEQEMPVPASPPTRTTFKPNGTPTKVEGGRNPESEMRMARLNSLLFPDKAVKIGDKWNGELKGEGNLPTLKAEYELVAKEKVGDIEALKIKFNIQEVAAQSGESSTMNTPTTMSGFIWIDPKTGMLVRMNGSVKGMPAEGAPMPLDGTLTMERIP